MAEARRQAGAAQQDEAVVDLAHLAAFTAGEAELECELAALYLSSAAMYLEQMALAVSRAEPWDRAAHALKGASANLGAGRVADLARAAEQAPPDHDQLTALRAAVDEVRCFFDQRHACGHHPACGDHRVADDGTP